jgi:hypothetical protein
MARLTVGAFEPALAPRAEAFAAACKAGRIRVRRRRGHPPRAVEKYVFLAAMSGCTSLARAPVGVIRSDPDLRATMEAAMREIVAVARAKGVDPGDEFVGKQLAFMDTLPEGMRSSMLNDLTAGQPPRRRRGWPAAWPAWRVKLALPRRSTPRSSRDEAVRRRRVPRRPDHARRRDAPAADLDHQRRRAFRGGLPLQLHPRRELRERARRALVLGS